MFIAVDLKVIEGLAGAVARSASTSEDRVLAGLVRLWHRCWADEVSNLDADELAGVFGLEEVARLARALVSFGFLETNSDGASWRVKGAGRYLRLKESRRRGAVATNAKKARSRATHNHALERGLSDAQTRSLTESPSHRVTEIKSLRAKKPPAPSKPPDPRHAPLVAELVEIFQENTGARYPFNGRAAKAVTALLAIEPEPERVSSVWRRALRSPGFPTVRTLPELVTHWAHFVGSGPPERGRVDPDDGIISSRGLPPPSKPVNLDEPVELPF